MKTLSLFAAAGMLAWPGSGAMDFTAGAPLPVAETLAGPDFSWHKAMAAGKTLEIKGINGEIRATLASGSEAEVSATKTGRRSDPDEVEIKVLEDADGVTICVLYPSPRNRQPNECGPGNQGRMNTDNNDVTVNFTVAVPAGVHLVANTVNGDIRAASLRSNVEAATVNGSIRIATSGRAEATTVNGSIDASMGKADWTDDVSFSTVNGGITLELPSEVNAELKASTVNGDISTDFPVTVQGRFGPRSIRGTLGRGGHELELETVNGSIALRKAE
ncbi:MAG: DUF4097 family beta strand repeat-containing protein [Gemmatimonadota bacterium]